jgi:hypothetical protein
MVLKKSNLLFLLLFSISHYLYSNTDTLPAKYLTTGELIDDTLSYNLPCVLNYNNLFKSSTAKSNRIIQRIDIDANQQLAQKIIVQNSAFQLFAKDTASDNTIRTEIFGIMPTRSSDLRKGKEMMCPNGDCYKVELYNYMFNNTKIGIVNIKTLAIVDSFFFPYSQPDIPPLLKEIAMEIACNSKEVIAALGFKPDSKSALMSDTKTSLNRSKCERSRHLCVAPTFVTGDKALWAIVDLTDFKVVGIRWTNIGTNLPNNTVTERQIQNEKLTECFCKVETSIAKNNWNLKYMLTSSDGLRISEVSFKKNPYIQSAKLVDWHVSYSNTDGFGYSDAVGCPFFSTAAVIAIESPKIIDMYRGNKKVGFALTQVFSSEGWPNACNYNYQQRYEFYDDGKMRVAVTSMGRGCGNNGTYRPVIRIAFAEDKSNFYSWKNDKWDLWKNETWAVQNDLTKYSKEGYLYKIRGKKSSFAIEPGNGQFKDGGRGDNAYTYITKSSPDKNEGEGDLITIGPCCNTDYQQGPEKFIDSPSEKIENSKLVFWYVPQLKNDDRPGNEYCWANSFLKDGVYSTFTYPCWAGPMIVPTKN